MPAMSAAILAGGHATRLRGADKSALRIGPASILERQLALLRRMQLDAVIVSRDLARFAGARVPVRPDLVEGRGALGGLHTALSEATTTYVLVIACDMPFLTRPFLTRLMQRAVGGDGAIPHDGRGRHPLCAVYARHVATHLGAQLDAGVLRVQDAIVGLALRELAGNELAAFDPNGKLLTNVNTPEDYARALGSPGSRPRTLKRTAPEHHSQSQPHDPR